MKKGLSSSSESTHLGLLIEVHRLAILLFPTPEISVGGPFSRPCLPVSVRGGTLHWCALVSFLHLSEDEYVDLARTALLSVNHASLLGTLMISSPPRPVSSGRGKMRFVLPHLLSTWHYLPP